MRALAGLVVLLAALVPARARAVPVDALDLGRDWTVDAIRFRGNDALSARMLRRAMVTQARPWWAPWRPRPAFDPVAFRTDLERLRRLYRSRGWYGARVEHDLELPAEGEALTLVVHVDEGPRTTVADVAVDFAGAVPPAEARRTLLASRPLRAGEPFTEEAYDRTLALLRAWYREHGYARVTVEKRAEVNAGAARARVAYRVESGPPTVFGATRVAGTRRVSRDVVRREIAWTPGAPFAQSRIDRTRENLVRLNLFRAIRIDEVPASDDAVDLVVRVTEAPHREVRLGVGYDTEEQVRGLASWRSYDFFGGARQLGFSARASLIERTLVADFLQPHFPGRGNRTRLLFAQTQEEEDTFTLDRTRLSPRLEWRVAERLSGYTFYRAEYDGLTDVSAAVRRRLPGAAPRDGILSGLGFGGDWNRTDDLLDPMRGWVIGATVEPVGGVLGGDFAFVRGVVEGRTYRPLVGRLNAAGRLRLGAADPTDGTGEIPLFERFYAGGINSVRGYGRREIGPRAPAGTGDPIGGRTLVEASVELRHPITESLRAVVFLDGGQVDVDSFDFPFDHLQYGTGVGARYRSPIGPVGLDLAFPIDPQPGDSRWQIHVSVGTAF
jgi:outer membrane protein insertion porin family/translocation and assembly module TamA